MAAYDNVSLPSPPNIATAGNFAQQLYSMLSGLGDAYQSGKNFNYQQRNQNLFQNGVPTTNGQPSGPMDYTAMLRQVLQAGGAPAIGAATPLLSAQAGGEISNAIGGQPQPANIGPATSTHAGPANITGDFGGQGGQPKLSATGSDTAGAESVRSLTAGIAGGRPVPDTTMANYARALGVDDPDAPLSAAQEARARKIIGNNLKVSGTAGATTKPVVSSGYENDENNTNEATPVGSTGGAQISPNPQGAGPGKGETFDSRLNAAKGGAQPSARPTPVGTEAEARTLQSKAANLRSIAARVAGLNPKAAEQAKDAADKMDDRAKQIFESLGKYNEPDRTTKAVQSGAARQEALDKSDVERFGKQYDAIQHQADETNKLVDTLKLTKGLMDQPGFYSGAGSDFVLSAKRIGVALGLTNPTEAQAMEAFGKTVSSAVMDQIRSLGGQGLGQVRVAEIKIMERAAQNHDNTPASNRLLTELQERLGEKWTLPIAELARNYKGGHLDAGFDKVKQDWINKHPLLSKEELDDPRRIAPPLARTPADLDKIGWKPGMPFRTPDDRVLTHAPQAGG